MRVVNSMKRFRFLPVSLVGLIGLMLVLPSVTWAHPLDQYILASYLTVAPEQIVVELDMTPGVLVAPQLLPVIDTNNDQQISEAESRAYADLVLKEVELKVDGQPQQLTFSKIEMPDLLNFQAGYGTMRLYAKVNLTQGLTGTHQLYYKNNYQPANPAYQVNTFVDESIPVTIGPQNRDAIQQSMTMDYTITGPEAASTSKPAANSSPDAATQFGSATGNPQQLQQVITFLYQPALSPWLLVVALGLTVVLGGLHALTPGHGKTMVAAYLVGSRGTARHAIALGGIVTFTHTISVIGLGLLALLASQFIVPTVLVPVLEAIAGLLVIGLGIRLILRRWHFLKEHRGAEDDHFHSHDHPHPHDHNHEHSHDHDHSHHTHAPLPETIKPSDILAMGVSGGLIPCPEALGILVVAVGLNRIGLGLGLIVAFSLGVGIVLISIGLLLVRARALLERLSNRGKSWQRWLPLVSAALVTLIGIVMVFSSLWKYPLALALAFLAVVIVTGGIMLGRRLFRSDHHQVISLPSYSRPE
jgi:ABC-type nickel/cobalt efflux system permease component RcnA